MYTVPLSDAQAFAIDDSDPDTWWISELDFEAKTIDRYSVEGMGSVEFAQYEPRRDLVWVISNGNVYAIVRPDQDIFEIGQPEPWFRAYAVVSTDDAILVCGEYSNLWRVVTAPELVWEPLQAPEPKQESDDEAEQSRLLKEYARKYPPLYAGFKLGDDYVFCGALGTLARVRGRAVETKKIGADQRFVHGKVEGTRIALSSDSPKGEICLGTFDEGVEAVFSDNLRAFHRTALHNGRRYIGVAEYPPSNVHNLYILEADGPASVDTGCAREPMGLISLVSTGAVLWAIDHAGMFRLANGTWTLVDANDLGDDWPANA